VGEGCTEGRVLDSLALVGDFTIIFINGNTSLMVKAVGEFSRVTANCSRLVSGTSALTPGIGCLGESCPSTSFFARRESTSSVDEHDVALKPMGFEAGDSPDGGTALVASSMAAPRDGVRASRMRLSAS
jgi:hypothetical protein